jgi:hypothetical protein
MWEDCMTVQLFGRVAGILLMTACLAGCVDITMDVQPTSEATAKGVMTQVMSAQVYPMLKANKKPGQPASADEFCSDGQLTENADGSATCVVSKEGPFADLAFDQGKENVKFSSAGPGLVRVAFPTAEMAKGLNGAMSQSGMGGAAAAGDPAKPADPEAAKQEEQMKQMMAAYFDGHFLTLKVSGGDITDTNMTLAADKRSAEQKIPFTDLINGTAKLPDELFAVVKVK